MTPEALIAALRQPWRHGEHLDARGSVFDAPVMLDGMNLRGFDLSGAHFKSGFSAKGATFLGLAWFANVRIDGRCDLTSARFRIDLRAEGLRTDVLCLDEAQVRGVLALARLHARKVSLSHALVMDNLTLEGAEISDGIDMSHAEVMGGFWAKDAELGRLRADGALIDGRVNRPDL